VRHHGALGGFVRVYCSGVTPEEVLQFVSGLQGVEAAYDKLTASSIFSLPPDREGDVVVISDATTVLGGAEDAHDLSALKGERLRSHGGIAESRVPLILSSPLNEKYKQWTKTRNMHNYNIFELALNGVLKK